MPRTNKPPNGGLPPADILEAYEKVVPGSAKAILDAFVKQSEHRQAMERQSLSARISIARWGQFFGFSIGIAALIAGAFSAYHGQQIAGSFIGAGGVVGLVSVFVLGRIKLGETTVER
jgi:uncharacterized membrane protein